MMIKILMILKFTMLVPHLIAYKTSKNKETIQYDINRWLKITRLGKKHGFLNLMNNMPEFRSLFYKRLGKPSRLLKFLCPPLSTLYIDTKDIGPGLFIQHGFATIIGARSIGKDCWINQQVTIGYSNATDSPILGDNVKIHAGAKIIGKVHMGNNSRAGANAVVVKDVPCDCTVVGVPAFIVRRNGIRVHEKL